MLPLISWKNVWRNKTRSLVVIIAMMIGVFSGSFIIALATGVIDSRSQDIISNQTAHIQLHHPKFSDYQEIQYLITDVNESVAKIEALPQVKAVTYKYKNLVMSHAGSQRGAINLVAINPEKDSAVFAIKNYLKYEGSTYFDSSIRNPILLSENTAFKHQLENYLLDSVAFFNLSHSSIPTEVVEKVKKLDGESFKKKKQFSLKLKEILTEDEYLVHKNRIFKSCAKLKIKRKIELSTYSYTNENIPETYRVVGYYKTNDAMFDGLNAFVLNDNFANQAQLPANTAHEIDIMLHDKASLDSVKQKLVTMFPDLLVETYRDVRPEVAMSEDMMDFYTLIIMSIILFALAFGIINTMLMAVLERTKEIGMLKAIGMNKKRVFFMIMYETVYLGLTGGVVGMVIAYFLISYLEVQGINLSMFQEGFEAMGYSSILYPKLQAEMFFQIVLLVIVTGILSAIIPARRALRLNPADAVRF
ncbi:MAG: ABC transporter permease [Bacteroidales bacterium]|nr:ABC transporter permease [Bacteroidales bacterium]